MKMKMLFGALALTVSGAAFAAEPPSPKKECCCKKGDDGKMACCEDKAKDAGKAGHEGHDMEGMNHK